MITLYIDQRIEFNHSIILEQDITGYSVAGQIRKWHGGKQYFDFVCTINDLATGNITIKLPNTTQIEPGRWLFDVILYNETTSQIIQKGVAIVSPTVTIWPQ